MNSYILIISIINILLLSNSLLENKFDKLTAFKDDKFPLTSIKFKLLYVFFGVFMFPFYKRIKEYRKIKYMEKELKYYDQWQKIIKENNYTGEHDFSVYINYKRYLQLKKIKSKL